MEQIGDSLWLAEGGNVDFYGFAYPVRMVIVRLPSGKLWIWSPIELTKDLKREVQAIGEVAHLVSPNKIHHLFLQDWKEAFPEAKLWGPASTIEKRKDLPFEAALDSVLPDSWEDALDLAHFTGSSFMDELVFYHRPSKTAILADLSENFSDDFLKENWSWWQRLIVPLWGIGVGKGHAPLEWRLSWFNKKQARKALDKVLGWDPVQVVMAHGEWQRTAGRAYLERSFSWLR